MAEFGNLKSTLITTPSTTKKVEQPVAQTKQQITPVKSNLPQMQQMAPASAAQVSAASRDPRFTQAITQKYQQDLAKRQQEYTKQQQQYQQDLAKRQQEFQANVGDKSRIQTLLNDITNEKQVAETEAQYNKRISDATAQYQKLMTAQLAPTQESNELQDARANLMALSRLSSGSALAGAYGLGADKSKTLGLIPDRGISQALSQARSATQEAEKQANISEQELALEKARVEELRGLSAAASGAEQAEFLTTLSNQAKVDKEAKDAALNNLKNAIYLGTEITQEQLDTIKGKLGLTDRDISELGSLSLKDVGGFENVTTLDSLASEIKRLRESATPLTDEQSRLINLYDTLEGSVIRDRDIEDPYAFANKSELAKINALRRLTGQTELSESDSILGKGREASKIVGLENLKAGIAGGTVDSETKKTLSTRIQDIDNILTGIGDFYVETGATSNDLGKLTKALNEKFGSAGMDFQNRVYGFYNNLQKDPKFRDVSKSNLAGLAIEKAKKEMEKERDRFVLDRGRSDQIVRGGGLRIGNPQGGV